MKQLIGIIFYSFYIPLYGLAVFLIKPTDYYTSLTERVNDLIIPGVLFADNCSQLNHVIQPAENTLYIYRASKTETQAYFYSLNTMDLEYCTHKFESKPQPVDELDDLFVSEHYDKLKPSYLVLNLLSEESVYMNLSEYEGLYKLKFLMRLWKLCAGLFICHVLSVLFVPYLDIYGEHIMFATVAFIIALLGGNWEPPKITDELVRVDEDDSNSSDGPDSGNQDGDNQGVGNQDTAPSKNKTDRNNCGQGSSVQGTSMNTETRDTVPTPTTTTITGTTSTEDTAPVPELTTGTGTSAGSRPITEARPTAGITGTIRTTSTTPIEGTASGAKSTKTTAGTTADTSATTAPGTDVNSGTNAGTDTQSGDQSGNYRGGNNVSGGNAQEGDADLNAQSTHSSQSGPSTQSDQPDRTKKACNRCRKPIWERRLDQTRQASIFDKPDPSDEPSPSGQPNSLQQSGSSAQHAQSAPSSPIGLPSSSSPTGQSGLTNRPGFTNPSSPSDPIYQPRADCAQDLYNPASPAQPKDGGSNPTDKRSSGPFPPRVSTICNQGEFLQHYAGPTMQDLVSPGQSSEDVWSHSGEIRDDAPLDPENPTIVDDDQFMQNQPAPSIKGPVDLGVNVEEQSNSEKNSRPGSDKSSYKESSNSGNQRQKSLASGEQQTVKEEKEKLYRLQVEAGREAKRQRKIEVKDKKKEAKRLRKEINRSFRGQQQQQQQQQQKKQKEDKKKEKKGVKKKQDEGPILGAEEEEYNGYSSGSSSTKDKGKQKASFGVRRQDPLQHKGYWDLESKAGLKKSSKSWSSLFDESEDYSRKPSKPKISAEHTWIQSSSSFDSFHRANINPLTRVRATTATDNSDTMVSTVTGRQSALSGSPSSSQHRAIQQDASTIRLQSILRLAGSSSSGKSSKQPFESSRSSSSSMPVSPTAIFPFLSDSSLTVESSHASPNDASNTPVEESEEKEEEDEKEEPSATRHADYF